MSEFSDRPLIGDSILGIRSFAVDRLGRLTGVSHRHVFTPGKNTATCSRGTMISFHVDMARAMQTITVAGTAKPDPKSADPQLPHDVANLQCSCGYYAYFDTDTNPHHQSANIQGLIRGTGTVTVGSRGFRAEHAELVALVRPGRKCHGRPLDGLARRLYKSIWVIPAGSVMLGAGLPIGIAAAVQSLWFLPLPIAAFIAGALLVYLSLRGIDVHYNTLERALIGTGDPQWRLVERNYPDVPIYSSARAALKDFPLTAPPPPRVPTPDTDPDFWTRAAS